tara:strand:+ start:488 stop:700 length:213 start_codon:yes stop_codon:yes gene_type:complete
MKKTRELKLKLDALPADLKVEIVHLSSISMQEEAVLHRGGVLSRSFFRDRESSAWGRALSAPPPRIISLF